MLLTLQACSSNNAHQSSSTSMRDQRIHALMVGELDQQLARLDVLAFDLHLTPGELDQQRRRRTNAIVRSAGQLRTSAGELLTLQSALSLQAADALRFATLAQQLQTTAATLEQEAASGRLDHLAPLMRELSATCNSCHSLYRDR